MYIQITTRCNMTCAHCCYSCTSSGTDMDSRTFEQAIKLAADLSHVISIGGGEPTVHPDFFKFVAMAQAYSKEDSPWLATNGKKTETALILSRLAKKGILSVALSIDAYHEPIDERVIEAFKRNPVTDSHKTTDLRDIKDITDNGNQEPFARGRALDIANREGCCCREIFVDPAGSIWACGCQEENWGTVFEPAIPDTKDLERILMVEKDETERKKAITVLGRIGKTAMPALILGLDDASISVRSHAVKALGKLGPKAIEALPNLLERQHDTSEDVRKSVLNAICRIDPMSEPAKKAFFTNLFF